MAFLLRTPEGMTNRVEGQRLRIGRGTDADLRFDDPGVSLAHAEIVQDAEVWRLVDLGSVTGTYLNG
jgi:pSer/pThr/pTyr-binding forkhead associated (FHA) protein